MTTCSECGTTSGVDCETLFHQLLALDHSRAEPWGPLHGVAVACFCLQHPSQLREGPEVPLELLRVFLAEDTAGAWRFTENRRHANSHRNRERARPSHAPAVASPSEFLVTIGDVAVDGTFTAPGHEQRVRAWAEATLAAWGRSD